MDSMALLHMMREAGFSDVIVCHLDHGLRGGESDRDARFVERVAAECGHVFEGGKVDLHALIEETGKSMETAGRSARHRFFAECSGRHGCESLVLAHHADDQAETVLWNLIRGSHGCRGMVEKRHLMVSSARLVVFRPLLGVRKQELYEWMGERGLEWREDGSNAVNDVVRNLLRNEAIPLLNRIANRDVSPMLARAAETDGEMREVVRWALSQARVFDPQGRLHIGVLGELPALLRTEAIRSLLVRSGIGGIDSALLKRCAGIMDVTVAASANLPGGARLRRKEGRLFVEPG